MKPLVLLMLAAVICLASNVNAQHNDVEFGYDDVNSPSTINVLPIGFSSTTADDIVLVRSSFRELDPFNPGEFSADQPGFATNTDLGLSVNAGNSINITALNALAESDFGVGYVNFYNPITDELEASGRIAFKDNTIGTSDLVLNGNSIESGDNPQFIGVASGSGDIHDHIEWDLLDDDTTPTGAYGILVQLEGEAQSDPFWIVFNFGMSTTDFEELALPKFGVGVGAVPQITAIELNGGEAQRSAVETLTVRFDTEVTIEAGAFSVVQRSTATEETFEEVTINVSEQVVNDETVVTIQFDSHTRNSENALVDGNYQLTVDASLVTNSGTPMAEDRVFGTEESDLFFALFGDSDGNRSINVFDLLVFRQSYLTSTGDSGYRYFMDFSANGSVNILDLLEFRKRYLSSLPFTF